MHPEPSPTRRRLLALALLALAAGLVALLVRPPQPASGPPRPATSSLSTDDAQRFYAIERERREIDGSVWAVEQEAERHEDVLIQLWDELRRNSDRLATLATFTFDELETAGLRPATQPAPGIDWSRAGSDRQRWTVDAWRARLRELRDAGLRLDQVEVRQSRFQPGPPARSTCLFRAHLTHGTSGERRVVRGTFTVDWRPSSDPSSPPFPRRVEVLDWEQLRHSGPPAFEPVLAASLDPLPGTIFIDPLIVHDLNGDGLPEIILGCRNELLWNRGRGGFERARLHAPLDTPLNTCLVADLTGDGRADLLAADHDGLLLWPGDPDGRFTSAPTRVWTAPDPLPNPFVLTVGDIDGDRDLDVWLAQYKLPYVEGQMPTPYYDANDGFPAFLLENDGRGMFRDRTEAAGLGPKRFRRTYSNSFVDLDGDRDLDLLVVSDFAGVDLYRNDGRGRFTDVTRDWVPDSHAFGMAHSFGDYNLDGRLDFFVVGMNSFVAERLDALGAGPAEPPEVRAMRRRMSYGNRLLLGQERGFAQTALSDQVARTGWSWAAASFDSENDGDLDLYITNGHKSRASARDYDRQFWRHDIYVGSSSHDPVRSAYFRANAERIYGQGASYGGYEINRLLLNHDGTGFLEAAHLLGVALQEDCRNLVAADLDADGRQDLILTTFEEWPAPRQQLLIFRNAQPTGHWIGFHLEGNAGGLSPIGARVRIVSPAGSREWRMVTGDSYRSQHPATAHFGLGTAPNVSSVEVNWPDGRTSRLTQPAPDRYHRLSPPE